MLSSIEIADGAPHAYIFAHHPSWIEESGPNWRRPITTPTFHADDFFIWWERAPDGPAVRAAEMQQAMNDMQETQRLMCLPPPDAAPVGLLTHTPAPSMGAELGTALATMDGVNAMQSFVDMQQEDLTRRAKWITKHSNNLREQGTVLANFHAERAQAMLAVAEVRKLDLEGILKTVANLRLYTGEGVEALLVCDGEPAAQDAKLTVYQDLLAFDQETGILLDSGGLDHTHTEELAEALKDIELVERMIPSELGMVLVQFRKKDKIFDKSEGIGAAIYNMQMNKHSQAKFLMIRDGERIWLVYIDDVLQPLSQLMPSTGEQNSYFTTPRFYDEKPERITKDDLAYAGAQRRQLGHLDLYGKVLIALWGLQDRTSLLVGGNIPKMSNWLSPEFQNAYMHLVSVDNLLGVSRPFFDTWQKEQNAHLAPGSWVAVNLSDAFTQDWIPGAFSRGRYYGGRYHYELFYKPNMDNARSDWGVVFSRAKKDTTGIYVELETIYTGHAEVKNPYRKNKLYLVRNDKPSEFNDGYLVLDRARSADLDYYLTSRKQRAGYLSYLKLFREARAWTADRDAAESNLRKMLAAEIKEARISHDPDQLDSLLTDALAIARTARRDGTVPPTGSVAFKDFLNAARAAAHAALSDNGSRVSAVESWAAEAGRQPLRLVLTGKSEWLLYCVPAEGEHDGRLGAPGHAIVRTVSFQDGRVDTAAIDHRLLRSVSGEQVIHDWDSTVEEVDEHFAQFPSYKPRIKQVGAKAWLVATAPFSIRYDQAVAVADSASMGRELMAKFDLESMFVNEAHHMRYSSGKSVQRTLVTVPVGTAIMNGEPLLLVARTDKMKFIYEHGDQAMRDRVLASMNIYKKKEMRRREILEQPMTWQLCAIPLDSAYKSRADMSELPSHHVDQDGCSEAGAPTKGYGNYQITTVSPFGVELFPWLVACTLAGT